MHPSKNVMLYKPAKMIGDVIISRVLLCPWPGHVISVSIMQFLCQI